MRHININLATLWFCVLKGKLIVVVSMINQILSINMCLHRPYLYLYIHALFQPYCSCFPSLLFAFRESIIGHVFPSLWSLSSLSACWIQGHAPSWWFLQKSGHTYLVYMIINVESICWCWKHVFVYAYWSYTVRGWHAEPYIVDINCV